jgi:hypothetical protein
VGVWRDAVRDSELDATAKLVAFVLSTYMNGRGCARPSKETLAAGASLSSGRRAVDHAVDRLEGAGFLEVERSRGRTANRYQATLSPTAHELRRSEWETAQETQPNRAPDDRQPRTSRRPTAHRVRTKALEARESRNDDAAPDGASSLPEGECWGCRVVGPLVGPRFHYCRACASGIEALAAEGAS